MHKYMDTREPWVAALLSCFFPGLGHIYGGCIRCGIVWFLSIYMAMLGFALLTETSLLSVFYVLLLVHVLFYILVVIDAHRCVRKAKDRQFNHRPRIAIYILFAVLIWFVERYYLHHRSEFLGVENYRLASDSMSPGLQKGDFVVVDTRKSRRQDLSVGDVVVFNLAGEKDVYVKRVAALSGEQIEIRLGRVYRNDVFEPRLEVLDQRRRRPGSQSMSALRVPTGEVFLLGDWRDNSKDSRARGTVPLGNILGKVSAVWFSADIDRIGRLDKPVVTQPQ